MMASSVQAAAYAMAGAMTIPVDPDAPDARRLLVDELAKPPYRAAQPSWFDTLSKNFFDWLASLFSGAGGAGGGWLPLVAVVVVVALVLAALLIWGLPRPNRRRPASNVLFGERDTRSAEEMRAAGRAAAAARNWPLAVAEQFRALAGGLSERTIVELSPGTTATDFARAAALTLPAERSAFAAAARAFDDVRYLGRSGSEADYRALCELERRVVAARPELRPAAELPGAHSGGTA